MLEKYDQIHNGAINPMQSARFKPCMRFIAGVIIASFLYQDVAWGMSSPYMPVNPSSAIMGNQLPPQNVLDQFANRLMPQAFAQYYDDDTSYYDSGVEMDMDYSYNPSSTSVNLPAGTDLGKFDRDFGVGTHYANAINPQIYSMKPMSVSVDMGNPANSLVNGMRAAVVPIVSVTPTTSQPYAAANYEAAGGYMNVNFVNNNAPGFAGIVGYDSKSTFNVAGNAITNTNSNLQNRAHVNDRLEAQKENKNILPDFDAKVSSLPNYTGTYTYKLTDTEDENKVRYAFTGEGQKARIDNGGVFSGEGDNLVFDKESDKLSGVGTAKETWRKQTYTPVKTSSGNYVGRMQISDQGNITPVVAHMDNPANTPSFTIKTLQCQIVPKSVTSNMGLGYLAQDTIQTTTTGGRMTFVGLLADATKGSIVDGSGVARGSEINGQKFDMITKVNAGSRTEVKVVNLATGKEVTDLATAGTLSTNDKGLTRELSIYTPVQDDYSAVGRDAMQAAGRMNQTVSLTSKFSGTDILGMLKDGNASLHATKNSPDNFAHESLFHAFNKTKNLNELSTVLDKIRAAVPEDQREDFDKAITYYVQKYNSERFENDLSQLDNPQFLQSVIEEFSRRKNNPASSDAPNQDKDHSLATATAGLMYEMAAQNMIDISKGFTPQVMERVASQMKDICRSYKGQDEALTRLGVAAFLGANQDSDQARLYGLVAANPQVRQILNDFYGKNVGMSVRNDLPIGGAQSASVQSGMEEPVKTQGTNLGTITENQTGRMLNAVNYQNVSVVFNAQAQMADGSDAGRLAMFDLGARYTMPTASATNPVAFQNYQITKPVDVVAGPHGSVAFEQAGSAAQPAANARGLSPEQLTDGAIKLNQTALNNGRLAKITYDANGTPTYRVFNVDAGLQAQEKTFTGEQIAAMPSYEHFQQATAVGLGETKEVTQVLKAFDDKQADMANVKNSLDPWMSKAKASQDVVKGVAISGAQAGSIRDADKMILPLDTRIEDYKFVQAGDKKEFLTARYNWQHNRTVEVNIDGYIENAARVTVANDGSVYRLNVAAGAAVTGKGANAFVDPSVVEINLGQGSKVISVGSEGKQVNIIESTLRITVEAGGTLILKGKSSDLNNQNVEIKVKAGQTLALNGMGIQGFIDSQLKPALAQATPGQSLLRGQSTDYIDITTSTQGDNRFTDSQSAGMGWKYDWNDKNQVSSSATGAYYGESSALEYQKGKISAYSLESRQYKPANLGGEQNIWSMVSGSRDGGVYADANIMRQTGALAGIAGMIDQLNASKDDMAGEMIRNKAGLILALTGQDRFTADKFQFGSLDKGAASQNMTGRFSLSSQNKLYLNVVEQGRQGTFMADDRGIEISRDRKGQVTSVGTRLLRYSRAGDRGIDAQIKYILPESGYTFKTNSLYSVGKGADIQAVLLTHDNAPKGDHQGSAELFADAGDLSVHVKSGLNRENLSLMGLKLNGNGMAVFNGLVVNSAATNNTVYRAGRVIDPDQAAMIREMFAMNQASEGSPVVKGARLQFLQQAINPDDGLEFASWQDALSYYQNNPNKPIMLKDTLAKGDAMAIIENNPALTEGDRKSVV